MNIKQPTDATQEVLYYLITRDYVTYKILAMDCEIQRPAYYMQQLQKHIKLLKTPAVHENCFKRQADVILWSAADKEQAKRYYNSLKKQDEDSKDATKQEEIVYTYYLNNDDNRIITLMEKFNITKPRANKIVNKGLDGKINIEI